LRDISEVSFALIFSTLLWTFLNCVLLLVKITNARKPPAREIKPPPAITPIKVLDDRDSSDFGQMPLKSVVPIGQVTH